MNNRIKKTTLSLSLALALTLGLGAMGVSATATRTYGDIDAVTGGVSIPKISSALSIADPKANINTTSATYYLTGSSDANQPILFNGGEVSARGTQGTWGAYVDLKMGANTFTIQQANTVKSVVITRVAPSVPSTTEALTDVLTKAGPVENSYAVQGEEYTLTCVAPSGAKVTATVGGETIPMTQLVATALAGVPARYSGKFLYTGNDGSSTKKIGNATYAMEWKGKATTYVSYGVMYGVPKNGALVVQVNNSSSNVFPESNTNNWELITVLRKGSKDYVVEQNDTMFKLSVGGWIDKSDVNILEGTPTALSSANGVSVNKDGRVEQIIFSGMDNPAFTTSMTDERFSITLHNTGNIKAIPLKTSSVVSGYAVSVANNSTTISFTKRAPNSIWGYDVSYTEKGETILTLTGTPKLSDNSGKPLTGITIALDPGHGGTDPGAVGILNGTGPMEKDMTIAQAQITKNRLESLGAKVIMTRTDDNKVELTPRSETAQSGGADMFIAIHINSMPLGSNGGKSAGVEVYTHDTMGKTLADNLAAYISSAANRTNRGGKYSNYKVTMYTYSPAVLAEIGFICNPEEYDFMCSRAGMFTTANAIADAVLATLQA